MRNKTKLTPMTAALGAALVATMGAMSSAHAADNPFGMSKLSSGYMVADGHMEGKCGEGKCGKADKEGKCGEGKCGKAGEGKCGKSGEGKCGEGKCGKK
jgi:uncharacterized low-complexity protein